MGKINAGILGGVSGKIGNVVGGSWKGIDWLRIWKKPATSTAAGSVAARQAMSFLIPFGKFNNETILKDNFAHVTKGKSLSPFNRFISINNKDRDPDAGFAGTRWSEGVVQPAPITDAEYDTTTGKLFITIDDTVDGYGAKSDKVQIFVSCKDDPAVDVVKSYDDGLTRETAVAAAGNGMYKILASKKKDGSNPSYAHVVCMNAAGEVSETSTAQITYFAS